VFLRAFVTSWSQSVAAVSAYHGRTRTSFTIERIPLGTNLFRLQVRGTDPAAFRGRLETSGVLVSAPQNGKFLIGVNETLNRTTATALADTFVRALEA
jgi:hypothetical protein